MEDTEHTADVAKADLKALGDAAKGTLKDAAQEAKGRAEGFLGNLADQVGDITTSHPKVDAYSPTTSYGRRAGEAMEPAPREEPTLGQALERGLTDGRFDRKDRVPEVETTVPVPDDPIENAPAKTPLQTPAPEPQRTDALGPKADANETEVEAIPSGGEGTQDAIQQATEEPVREEAPEQEQTEPDQEQSQSEDQSEDQGRDQPREQDAEPAEPRNLDELFVQRYGQERYDAARNWSKLLGEGAKATAQGLMDSDWGDNAVRAFDSTRRIVSSFLTGNPMSAASTIVGESVSNLNALADSAEDIGRRFGIAAGANQQLLNDTVVGKLHRRKLDQDRRITNEVLMQVDGALTDLGADDITQLSSAQMDRFFDTMAAKHDEATTALRQYYAGERDMTQLERDAAYKQMKVYGQVISDIASQSDDRKKQYAKEAARLRNLNANRNRLEKERSQALIERKRRGTTGLGRVAMEVLGDRVDLNGAGEPPERSYTRFRNTLESRLNSSDLAPEQRRAYTQALDWVTQAMVTPERRAWDDMLAATTDEGRAIAGLTQRGVPVNPDGTYNANHAKTVAENADRWLKTHGATAAPDQVAMYTRIRDRARELSKTDAQRRREAADSEFSQRYDASSPEAKMIYDVLGEKGRGINLGADGMPAEDYERAVLREVRNRLKGDDLDDGTRAFLEDYTKRIDRRRWTETRRRREEWDAQANPQTRLIRDALGRLDIGIDPVTGEIPDGKKGLAAGRVEKYLFEHPGIDDASRSYLESMAKQWSKDAETIRDSKNKSKTKKAIYADRSKSISERLMGGHKNTKENPVISGITGYAVSDRILNMDAERAAQWQDENIATEHPYVYDALGQGMSLEQIAASDDDLLVQDYEEMIGDPRFIADQHAVDNLRRMSEYKAFERKIRIRATAMGVGPEEVEADLNGLRLNCYANIGKRADDGNATKYIPPSDDDGYMDQMLDVLQKYGLAKRTASGEGDAETTGGRDATRRKGHRGSDTSNIETHLQFGGESPLEQQASVQGMELTGEALDILRELRDQSRATRETMNAIGSTLRGIGSTVDAIGQRQEAYYDPDKRAVRATSVDPDRPVTVNLQQPYSQSTTVRAPVRMAGSRNTTATMDMGQGEGTPEETPVETPEEGPVAPYSMSQPAFTANGSEIHNRLKDMNRVFRGAKATPEERVQLHEEISDMFGGEVPTVEELEAEEARLQDEWREYYKKKTIPKNVQREIRMAVYGDEKPTMLRNQLKAYHAYDPAQDRADIEARRQAEEDAKRQAEAEEYDRRRDAREFDFEGRGNQLTDEERARLNEMYRSPEPPPEPVDYTAEAESRIDEIMRDIEAGNMTSEDANKLLSDEMAWMDPERKAAYEAVMEHMVGPGEKDEAAAPPGGDDTGGNVPPVEEEEAEETETEEAKEVKTEEAEVKEVPEEIRARLAEEPPQFISTLNAAEYDKRLSQLDTSKYKMDDSMSLIRRNLKLKRILEGSPTEDAEADRKLVAQAREFRENLPYLDYLYDTMMTKPGAAPHENRIATTIYGGARKYAHELADRVDEVEAIVSAEDYGRPVKGKEEGKPTIDSNDPRDVRNKAYTETPPSVGANQWKNDREDKILDKREGEKTEVDLKALQDRFGFKPYEPAEAEELSGIAYDPMTINRMEKRMQDIALAADGSDELSDEDKVFLKDLQDSLTERMSRYTDELSRVAQEAGEDSPEYEAAKDLLRRTYLGGMDPRTAQGYLQDFLQPINDGGPQGLREYRAGQKARAQTGTLEGKQEIADREAHQEDLDSRKDKREEKKDRTKRRGKKETVEEGKKFVRRKREAKAEAPKPPETAPIEVESAPEVENEVEEIPEKTDWKLNELEDYDPSIFTGSQETLDRLSGYRFRDRPTHEGISDIQFTLDALKQSMDRGEDDSKVHYNAEELGWALNNSLESTEEAIRAFRDLAPGVPIPDLVPGWGKYLDAHPELRAEGTDPKRSGQPTTKRRMKEQGEQSPRVEELEGYDKGEHYDISQDLMDTLHTIDPKAKWNAPDLYDVQSLVETLNIKASGGFEGIPWEDIEEELRDKLGTKYRTAVVDEILTKIAPPKPVNKTRSFREMMSAAMEDFTKNHNARMMERGNILREGYRPDGTA